MENRNTMVFAKLKDVKIVYSDLTKTLYLARYSSRGDRLLDKRPLTTEEVSLAQKAITDINASLENGRAI